MKRRSVPKTNKKYFIFGLLLALFLSLYYLSIQKKKEGMKSKSKRQGYKNKKENMTTEDLLREKIEGFKEKLEKLKDEKNALIEENEELEEDKKKVESKLRNVESINKITI